MQLDENQVYFGATALTAITDNAALTYLSSLGSGPIHHPLAACFSLRKETHQSAPFSG